MNIVTAFMMITLRYRFNYANKVLTHSAGSERVGVYLRDGGVKYERWLGFIELDLARALPNSKAVNVKIEQYSDDDMGLNWCDVPEGSFVQRCLIEHGVFAVVESRLRVVRCR